MDVAVLGIIRAELGQRDHLGGDGSGLVGVLGCGDHGQERVGDHGQCEKIVYQLGISCAT
jgi:hypothetical protein